MIYGIIAAGEGSRLLSEGITEPKPLVTIGGETLIDRLIRIFNDNEAEEIYIICNEEMKMVEAHISNVMKEKQGKGDAEIKLKVKTTPSSMHSFSEISELFPEDKPFVVTTVDTIFRERCFSEYIRTFSETVASGDGDGLMGITTYIDDEKPLYVGVDSDKRITGFYDNRHGECISAGIYGLTQRSLPTLKRCLQRGESRMRNFQRALIADGLRLKAFDLGKVLDIDHASDILKAEELLK